MRKEEMPNQLTANQEMLETNNTAEEWTAEVGTTIPPSVREPSPATKKWWGRTPKARPPEQERTHGWNSLQSPNSSA